MGCITLVSIGTQTTLYGTLPDNDAEVSSSHRVVATELHGTADGHDRDELPAHRAVLEEFPWSPGSQAFDFSLFLQNLIELAVLDVTASQTFQG